ncbi:cilia- and flagella-associated protein 157 [Pempheris klunzingeri]|uniref:cilia- and flagella-associated protein 157 n=1 Tax=Pempheris klunzingeri TaxID=3127111 RepID=UPI0039800D9D
MAVKISSEGKAASLYLIQIQYLDEQLERCQQKCEELEEQNTVLSAQYSALEKDKKDTTEYLKRCLAAKEKKVEEQTEQLESQRWAAVLDNEALKLQHSREMEEQQGRVSELDSESRMYVVRFEEEKEQLKRLVLELVDTEPLEKQLVCQREEQEAAVHTLKEQIHLNREKLIEMLKNSVDDWVQLKSHAVLQEELGAQSIALAERLQFLLEENVVLQEEIDNLRGREREIDMEIKEIKEELSKIIDESATCSKELVQLPKKNHELRVEIKICIDDYQHILSREEDLRKRLASESKKWDGRAAEVDQLKAELQRERSRERLLEGVTQEAAIILRHILTVKTQSQDPNEPSDTQWKARRLLEVLESAAPTGPDSTLNESPERSSRGRKPQTPDPKPARRKKSSSVDPSAPDPPPEAGAEMKVSVSLFLLLDL